MSTHAKARPLFDPADRARGDASTSFRKLDPRHPGAEPGHVRRPGRQRRSRRCSSSRRCSAGARRRPGSSSPSRSGSGSRCCSPTSPRRWPRGAARRRPRASAGAPRHHGEEARSTRRAAASTPRSARVTDTTSAVLRKGDVVLVEAGEFIPSDGEIVEGVASVDESAITGESAPVIREAGGDRSAVTGGTRVLSDWLVVRITSRPGRDLPRPHDRAWSRARSGRRRRTRSRSTSCSPALTIIFLLATVTLLPFSIYGVNEAGQGTPVTVTVLVALLVCLIPTTIGGLLSAIGIAGMDRMIQANVIAISGRAVEAAGDVDVLLLDKTGTITLGNRQATAFLPGRRRRRASGWPTRRSSPRSPTRRPRAAASSCSPRSSYGLRERDVHALGAHFVPFTRADADERRRPRRPRRSARAPPMRSRRTCSEQGGAVPGRGARSASRRSPREGGTPLVVAEGAQVLGVIQLKDIVKGGIKERFAELRAHGHQDGDDHRRQPAHRGGHRRRGRRRRLPRRGHARGQARRSSASTRRAAGWSR